MTKKEELLIDWCKLLKMHKEAILVVMACLRTDRQTDRQQGTMLDWLMKHYQENPSEDMILQVAEKISVAIT